jgi:hypothetical protein
MEEWMRMWNDGSRLTDHILKRFVVYNKIDFCSTCGKGSLNSNDIVCTFICSVGFWVVSRISYTMLFFQVGITIAVKVYSALEPVEDKSLYLAFDLLSKNMKNRR